jgi:hypothetical protein
VQGGSRDLGPAGALSRAISFTALAASWQRGSHAVLTYRSITRNKVRESSEMLGYKMRRTGKICDRSELAKLTQSRVSRRRSAGSYFYIVSWSIMFGVESR